MGETEEYRKRQGHGKLELVDLNDELEITLRKDVARSLKNLDEYLGRKRQEGRSAGDAGSRGT